MSRNEWYAAPRIASALLVLIASGCDAPEWSTVHGTLSTSGGVLGNATTNLDFCRSGHPLGFYGAVLRSSATPSFFVRVVAREEERVVLVSALKPDARVRFGANDCKVFNVVLKQENSHLNGVPFMSGSIELDCTEHGDDTTAHVEGSVNFRNCPG